MEIAKNWLDYELLDMHKGEKLERWGNIITRRPDPQVIWPGDINSRNWKNAHMHYHRDKSGGVAWGNSTSAVPDSWQINYNGLRFKIKPTDFKHMGLFPEQAVNWDWAMKMIKGAKRQIRLLNLFGYTGGATVASLQAGADVTHIDAAKGMNEWAKENIALSNLNSQKHRVLTDDVMKFVKREARRESRYDAIIMDPPSFGRGPSGEMWKLENRLYDLVHESLKTLTISPLFVLLNSYTSGLSPTVASNILRVAASNLHLKCDITYGEIGLKASSSGLTLPCGIYGRAIFN